LATGSALTFDGTSLSVSGGRVNASTADAGGTIGGTAQFVTVNTNASVGDFSGIRFNYFNSGDSGGKFAYIGAVLTSGATNGIADMVFGVKSSIATTTITEQMRLTSSSLYTASGINVAFGTSSIGARLTTQASANSYTAGAFQINSLSGTYKSYITNVGGLLLFSNSSTVDQLTLDASGNLGLGVTPSAWSGWGNPIFQLGGAGTIVSNTTVAYLGANFYYNAGYKYIAASAASYYLQNAGSHAWYRSTSTPVVGNDPVFSAAMTLDASGNLLVSGTSTGFVNKNQISLEGPAGYEVINHVSGTSSGEYYLALGYNGSGIGSITQSGTTAVLYNLTSDQRLKENIQDAESSSILIDAIQVRQFDWKSDGSHTRYGFIAQELVTVAPEAVHQPANPDEMMAVDYSKLVPMLVKEIQSLRQRLSAANL
jgi:hypothetical protein